MRRTATIIYSVIGTCSFALIAAGGVWAQQGGGLNSVSDAREALQRALAEANAADIRGKRLEAEAKEASEAAERTAREAAALAARIQQAEAGIAAAEARITIIGGQRSQLSSRLAERRGPLVRLTGALQKLARRPLALSALKPGSVRETVYLRAMLESTIPQVRVRTSALRAEIDRAKQLEQEAQQALAQLQKSETELGVRQNRLATLETQQRLVSRQAGGEANRESERALALAEEARDLDALAEKFGAEAGTRKSLADLPGPILRPDSPQQSLAAPAPPPSPSSTIGGGAFQLPVAGRTVAGFGAAGDGGLRNKGLSLAPRGGAQVIAPARGRVAFAGPYRGYDRIVIMEHDGGWTSLVTGMARTDVNVGERLVAGAPLGVAGVNGPIVTLELRRNGKPVNPLDYIR